MPDPEITPAILERVGLACYGAQWLRPMAAELPVNYRTLQRWAAATYPPAPWTAEALRDLVAAELACARARLGARADQVKARPVVGGLAEDAAARVADLESLRDYLADL